MTFSKDVLDKYNWNIRANIGLHGPVTKLIDLISIISMHYLTTGKLGSIKYYKALLSEVYVA